MSKKNCVTCYYGRMLSLQPPPDTRKELVCCHDIQPFPCFIRDNNDCVNYLQNSEYFNNLDTTGEKNNEN
nr:MAG: hypothetical protein [Microvirus sp.]